MTAPTGTATKAWDLLAAVPDPEIPVVSVVDLGIVRDVVESADGRAVTVTITPTYSGCPATEVIARDVAAALAAAYDDVDVRTQLSPAWTTDWMSDAGKAKLSDFGIAPPAGQVANVINLGSHIGHRVRNDEPNDHVCDDAPQGCPRCGSTDVSEIAGFGSTPCKALWRCEQCREPFDYFKRH